MGLTNKLLTVFSREFLLCLFFYDLSLHLRFSLACPPMVFFSFFDVVFRLYLYLFFFTFSIILWFKVLFFSLSCIYHVSVIFLFISGLISCGFSFPFFLFWSSIYFFNFLYLKSNFDLYLIYSTFLWSFISVHLWSVSYNFFPSMF